jgi:ketosteroid isomerase-like protein
VAFENFATVHDHILGYTLEIERFETRVAGGSSLVTVALRVTSVFRNENDLWKLVHRHADPITTPLSVSAHSRLVPPRN